MRSQAYDSVLIRHAYRLNDDNDSTTTLTPYRAFNLCQVFGERFVYIAPFNPYKIPAKYAPIIIDVEIEAI